MADLIIKDNELEKAVILADRIYLKLNDALIEANKMKRFLEQSKWKGKTRDAFYVYLSLIIQYHEDLNNIMQEHARVIKDLKDNIEKFKTSDLYTSIKGL